MKRFIIILSFLGLATAQKSPFTNFDVVLYPEYYFEGLMAEVDGEIKEGQVPLNFEMDVPANTDSVFFVSGTAASEPAVKHLSVLKQNQRSYVQVSIIESKFRMFIFFDGHKDGIKRSGDFTLKLNHPVDDAHIIIQEPLVAENFSFSEAEAESFKDQHGINFNRIHIHDFKANTAKSVSFSYENPSGEISINKLQTMLASDDRTASSVPAPTTNQKPIRHKLPLWQPLVVLAVVAVIVGWMASVQWKKETNESGASVPKTGGGKFCTHCGEGISPEHKFCAHCGGKL
jgi:hypothetical protein